MSEIRQMSSAPTMREQRRGGDLVDRHRHNDHQLVYVSTGVIAVTTESGSWVTGRDRAVWLPAGTWHDHRFYGTTSFHTLGFSETDRPLPAESPTVVDVDDLMRELLIACSDPTVSPRDDAHMRTVIRDRLRSTTLAPIWLPAPTDPRLATACEIIEQNLSEPVGLEHLARAVHTAPRTLSRLFRSELGMTFPAWRSNRRVLTAMVHLAEGRDVTTTAHLCGWSTPSAFVDTFRRATGQTPGAYRSLVSRHDRKRPPSADQRSTLQ